MKDKEVDFDSIKGKWEDKRRLVSNEPCELIERDNNGRRLREGLMVVLSGLENIVSI